MPRIIVLDTLSPDGLALLDAAKPKGIDYEVRTGLKGDALREALAQFEGAICRSGVKITADALAGNHRLKAIVRAGVGTDNIDREAATRLGIVVMNTPAGNTVSTAEHTLAMMLAMSRNIAPAYQSLLEHRWDRNKFMGAQLAGKTLGVVGLGRIGQAVAKRAQAFEMRVLGFDPFLSRDRTQELGVEPADGVQAMLPEIDYLTVHTPLTEETRNLISHAEIELLRPTARLVNCARGGIYDEAALAEALKAKRIAGVALDVYAAEPCTDNPLFGLPGVVCTPHLGASTEEAQTQVAVEGVGLLVDFLTTGAVRHAVNMNPLDRQTLESLRGYLNVAHRLGLLLSQWDRSAPKRCVLHYRGEVAGKNTKLLTAAFAVGLLENALEEEVNLVNAELLLRERGIEVVEQSRADLGAFSSLITVELITASGNHRAAGTILGQDMPRLVELDHHRLEAFLDGVLLIFTHRDVPGIIGRVGTIFGRQQINIAQMAVGRAGPGGEAVGVLNLDQEPSAAALAEVTGSPDIRSATVIRLPAAGQLPAWMQ
ncbi:MAG TPA: phosphoglycerate dehydrogenase [Pirellulales bacterium]|jgi:D-3-phosphoglycerate dehydrogenase|nr:phosphoglycerate dehydrogenase [Pirellulales bacterium]